MKKSNTGSSIMIAVILTFIMVGIGIFILSYIIPFSRATVGIENSVKAYYKSYSGIEESLLEKTSSSDGDIKGYRNYVFQNKSNIIPIDGQGNSEFDSNYNKIKVGQPLELNFKNDGLNFSTGVKLKVRVPDLDGNNVYDEKVQGADGDNVLNWTMSGTTNIGGKEVTLQADPSKDNGLIKVKKINGTEISIGNYNGVNTSTGASEQMTNFFNDIKKSDVKLKITLINNDLRTTAGKKIPYLEYKLTLNSDINDRFTNVSSTGRTYDYQKNIKIRVPSETTSEAFDFTIFQ